MEDLWTKISWNVSFGTQLASQLPELNDLVNHFQEKAKTADDSTLLCYVNTQTYVPVLDDDIEENEVKDAVKKLKEDKSTGDDFEA